MQYHAVGSQSYIVRLMPCLPAAIVLERCAAMYVMAMAVMMVVVAAVKLVLIGWHPHLDPHPHVSSVVTLNMVKQS